MLIKATLSIKNSDFIIKYSINDFKYLFFQYNEMNKKVIDFIDDLSTKV